MNLQQQLGHRPDLQNYLFRRGFIISQREFDMNNFPFYGNWNLEKLGVYHFMTHKDAKFHYFEMDGVIHFLLGHCYNPFTMEHEERVQLEKIATEYAKGETQYWEAVDELTGVFVMGHFDKNGISYLTDPSGMQSAYYGIVDGNFMITSHPQIIGDIYNLEMDEFVKELIAYKWYPRFLGAYLPGDISQFKEVKRAVPSICFEYSHSGEISHKRFYPREKVVEVTTDEEYSEVILKAASILKNNAELILRKWDCPAISLTGGLDSTTTYAAFNGHYDQVESFTYQSADKEVPDVEAAKIISDRFKTNHKTYVIPDQDSELVDFDLKWAIITHNAGYISLRKKNEVRKRIYLEENCHNDVEIKSWVSEVTRARWYKHLRRSSMPPLSPKLFRSLYKIFLTNRPMAYKVEKIFKEYITKYEYEKIVPLNYLPADMFMTEMIYGSWGGPGISEMKYIFDLTIPFSNRIYFNTMFRLPLKDRISDKHLVMVKKVLNKEMADMNIRVINKNDTVLRDTIQNVIFTTNMILPF